MQLEVYDWLRKINAGFGDVITALTSLREYGAFHRSELDRLASLAKETRACINSFLTNTIEVAETEDAGRLYAKRRRQEKRDDEGA